MPELAEVERARKDCQAAVEGKTITGILTREDKIVYANCSHEDFAKHVKGQTVQRVGRLGKYFYLVLQTAPHILLHLGMAGFVSTRGKEPLFYRRKAKNWKNDDSSDWPLRYWKFALTMSDGTEWCFCDSRRLGRIKLIGEVDKPVEEAEPLSLLGRDPYLDMPTLTELSDAILRRKTPIKALLLNQNGPLCGIGNWLVDEILFQARVHPAQRCTTLSASQLLAIHTQIQAVVNTAVECNAVHSLFPKYWLFSHRWGKGKRKEAATFLLPDGTTATVTHQTVGGRTSAIIESVQKLPEGTADGEDSEGEGQVSGGTGSDGEHGIDSASEGHPTPEKSRAKTATPKRASASSTKTPKSAPAVKTGRKPAKTPGSKKRKAKKQDASGSESDLTPVEDGEDDADYLVKKDEVEEAITKASPRKRLPRAKKEEVDEDEQVVAMMEGAPDSPAVRRSARSIRIVKVP